jgi:hypothetical protein
MFLLIRAAQEGWSSPIARRGPEVRITRQNGNPRLASERSYLPRLKLPPEKVARLILAEA